MYKQIYMNPKRKKIEETTSGLKYVKIEDDSGSHPIWWPALVALSWKGLMTLLPTDLKAKAFIVYLQMDKHERIAENVWIYVLGKLPGNKRRPLLAVTKEQAQSLLCDFYENLDIMNEQFGSIHSWSEASTDAVHWLREHSQIHAVVSSCPSGDEISSKTSGDTPSAPDNLSMYSENLRWGSKRTDLQLTISLNTSECSNNEKYRSSKLVTPQTKVSYSSRSETKSKTDFMNSSSKEETSQEDEKSEQVRKKMKRSGSFSGQEYEPFMKVKNHCVDQELNKIKSEFDDLRRDNYAVRQENDALKKERMNLQSHIKRMDLAIKDLNNRNAKQKDQIVGLQALFQKMRETLNGFESV